MIDPYDLLQRWNDTATSGDYDERLVAETIRALAEHRQRHNRYTAQAAARLFDPDPSHRTVRSIAADTTLRTMIADTAATLGVFDDRDLTTAIAQRYGVKPERNVVARARGLLEPTGLIVRLDVRERPDRRQATTHFTHWRHQP